VRQVGYLQRLQLLTLFLNIYITCRL